jgi:hypothetical protein
MSVTATQLRRYPTSQARSTHTVEANSTALQGPDVRAKGHCLSPGRTTLSTGATKGRSSYAGCDEIWHPALSTLAIVVADSDSGALVGACRRNAESRPYGARDACQMVTVTRASAVNPNTTADISVASVRSRSASQPGYSCRRPPSVPGVLQTLASLHLPLGLRSNARKGIRRVGSPVNVLQPSGSDSSVVTAARGVEGVGHEPRT